MNAIGRVREPVVSPTNWPRILLSLFRQAERCAGSARHAPDLIAWGQYYLPEHFQSVPSGMQRWLANELAAMDQERGLKVNLLGPRGGAKSTLGALAYPLRLALAGHEPYIWIVSDTRHQACAHLENVKAELLDNRRIARDYPGAAGRGSAWRAGAIRLANGVAIEAFGTGQRIRGQRHRAWRPSLIICDDLQNDRHIESSFARDHSRRWFHGTLLKAGTKRTNVLNLATALHPEALALELHRTPGWRSARFQAIEVWPENMQLWEQWETIYADVEQPDSRQLAREFFETRRAEMEMGARLLWPEEEDLYTLMRMRVEGGRSAFEREKQNSPLQPELCEWPESYFDSHIWFDDWPRGLRWKALALDPSKGRDDRRGDYSAYVFLGADDQGLLYVEAELVRRPTPEMVTCGIELYRRFRPDAIGIEVNQFQELLSGIFQEEFRRQGIFGVPLWTLDNRVNKRVRIRRLGPLLSNRRLRFKVDSPSTRLLVSQLKEFPLGEHDDGPDALEMAVRLLDEAAQPPATGDGLGSRLTLPV